MPIVCTIGMIVLWAATPFIFPHVFSIIPTDHGCVGADCPAPERVLGMYGTVGDMFGAVNALFSGLALAGVVLTVYWQAEERRRDRKPFLIPSLDEANGGSVVMVTPKRDQGVITLPIEFKLSLKNASTQAAINVLVEVAIDALAMSARAVCALPLAADGKAEVIVLGLVSGTMANELVVALRTGPPLKLRLDASCDSLEGVRWISSVTYGLELSQKSGRDAEIIARAVKDDATGSEATWDKGTKVALITSQTEGGWKFREG